MHLLISIALGNHIRKLCLDFTLKIPHNTTRSHDRFRLICTACGQILKAVGY
jgi:hypothetical protein